MIPLYSKVILTTDCFSDQGTQKGMEGYIIDKYSDGNYEVEFSDTKTGITQVQIVTSEDNLELFNGKRGQEEKS